MQQVEVKAKTIQGKQGWVVCWSDLFGRSEVPVAKSFGMSSMGPRLALEELCISKGWGVVAFDEQPEGGLLAYVEATGVC